jgi:hypothetical protein
MPGPLPWLWCGPYPSGTFENEKPSPRTSDASNSTTRDTGSVGRGAVEGGLEASMPEHHTVPDALIPEGPSPSLHLGLTRPYARNVKKPAEVTGAQSL